MSAGRQRGKSCLADVDWAVIEDDDNGLCPQARSWAIEPVEGFQVGDKIGAALGAGGGDGQLASQPVKRAHHGGLFGLSRRGDAQIGSAPRPSARQIGMRERLALVCIKQNNVAGLGLALPQQQPQANAVHLGRVLAPLQRVTGPAPAEAPFLRSALDSCDRPILTPSRASTSAIRRGTVQLGRLATGASSKGVITRSAASVFSGGGPGATLAFNLDAAAHEIAAPKP